ncbi:MAG: mobilization protein [Sphingobacteriales bacterium 50-39]|nr:plasmid mobilization relaxosome protein MobC [Sphingobacteriales bacterium]OJW59103.1 MAG: mobilization protein [Sphingobacteriales bacterium 50-39]
MEPEKNIRDKWLTVRLNPEEYVELQRLFKNTTCRQMSDYVRRVILSRPINVKYRNASVDDFLADMLTMKKELNAVGNNFNQTVHKLHTLDHVPDIRQWAIRNEQEKAILFEKIDTIMKRVNELYKLWCQ